jgi:hypothetical protein
LFFANSLIHQALEEGLSIGAGIGRRGRAGSRGVVRLVRGRRYADSKALTAMPPRNMLASHGLALQKVQWEGGRQHHGPATAATRP